ncbi:preprotein translocase subunit SecG [bacterium]|nr:preprotein translocase subunit SecG [bacterium]
MFYSILLFLFILCCITIITIILMQSGRGQGLAGVFGGGEIQSMLGTQATNILEKITWGAVASFFILTIILSLTNSQKRSSIIDKIPIEQPAPKAAQQAQIPVAPSAAKTVQQAEVPAGADEQTPVTEQNAPVPETQTNTVPAQTKTEIPLQEAPAIPAK